MTAVRWAIVGYGPGGRIFHAPLLASAAEIDLVAVLTTSAERRASMAADLPGAVPAGSIAELAGLGVQGVTVTTPVTTHADLAREAIGHGLAVVVDKPFSTDAASARAVVTAAEAAGTPLSVYQNRRWDADFRTVRRLVADGTLGEVRRFESRFERWAPDREPPAAGGGTLLDFGSHLVDQATVLNGPVTRVYAETRADSDVFVALHHAGGALSHLWGSWRQAAPGPRFRVSGTTGTYVSDGLDGQEAALKAGRSPARLGERWGVEPEHHWGRLYRGATGAPVPAERGRWDTFYPAMAAAVLGEGKVPVDPWDAVRTAEVLDAARLSATTGSTVRL